MKKNSLIIIISITIVVFITYFSFVTYSKIYNEKMLNIINEIIINNPEINIDDITKILKNSNDSDLNVLEDYGYNKDSLYFINGIESKYNNVLIINICIVIILVLLYIKTLNREKKVKEKEIDELIYYLDQINSGKYNIELERYTEGEFSRLRDQIYKTTVILKENESFLLKDKILLKNNLADISHQLKTPLTSMILMLENVVEDDNMSEEKKKEFILKIVKQTEKMKYLIEVLLKISRFDACVIDFKKDKIKSSVLIEIVISNLNYLLDEKNININKNFKNDNLLICDKKWQEEALTNILKNSIENSPADGVIDIKIIDNNFYTSFFIKDNGKGISKKMQKVIFERFKKSESSTGVGIGLNLAKTIIEKDNGIILINSIENKYTEFEIKYLKNK